MRGKEMGGGLRRLDNTGGWGGRDRTSEWRNQNPLPYRLATPQLALAGTAEEQTTVNSSAGRRSIERRPPFQQAAPVKFASPAPVRAQPLEAGRRRSVSPAPFGSAVNVNGRSGS